MRRTRPLAQAKGSSKLTQSNNADAQSIRIDAVVCFLHLGRAQIATSMFIPIGHEVNPGEL